jgi:osmotically inducible lipoprotein OsmB
MRAITATFCGGLLIALAACGDNATERAATGGLGGAVVAGPAGAIVGGTVGAATAN